MVRQRTRSLRAAACAGGMARQYRVQCFNRRISYWQMVGTFRRRELAEATLARLTRTGHRARMVDFATCPPAC